MSKSMSAAGIGSKFANVVTSSVQEIVSGVFNELVAPATRSKHSKNTIVPGVTSME